MHIDMDAFFASVEQRVNPSLRGKPVIIGGRNFKYRSIICAASYEAKAMGITNAMPSWKALKICPQAVFVPADTAKYIYTSNQIHDLLKTFSPQVEKFSVDEFFLDIKGCEHLFQSAENMGRIIKDRIYRRFGITCSIGVAPTKITAKIAAKMHKPNGLSVMSKPEIIEQLKDMPVEKICGIGSRLKRRFNLLGVHTCGQLADYPTDLLQRHFGVIGVWLKTACLVEDIVDIDYFERANNPPKSIGHSQTLRETTDDVEFIKEWIYLLSEMVGQRMRRKRLQGKTVYFYISDGFERGFSKRITFAQPSNDGLEIYQRCLQIIDQLNIEHLYARVLGVSVSNLQAAYDDYLFEEDKRRSRLIEHMDHINDRFGEWTIYPASLKRARY